MREGAVETVIAESWEATKEHDVRHATGGPGVFAQAIDAYGDGLEPARARLAAAAPALVRSLLLAEWGNPAHWNGPANPSSPTVRYDPGYLDGTCPVCLGRQYKPGPRTHDDDCALDAALKKAGLETAEQRDQARKELEGVAATVAAMYEAPKAGGR